MRPTAPGEQILTHARRTLAAAEISSGRRRRGATALRAAASRRYSDARALSPCLMFFPAAQQGLRALRLVLSRFDRPAIELVAAGKLDAAIIASDPESCRPLNPKLVR